MGILDFCREPRATPREGVEDAPLLSAVDDLAAFAAISQRNCSLFMIEGQFVDYRQYYALLGGCDVNLSPDVHCTMMLLVNEVSRETGSLETYGDRWDQ